MRRVDKNCVEQSLTVFWILPFVWKRESSVKYRWNKHVKRESHILNVLILDFVNLALWCSRKCFASILGEGIAQSTTDVPKYLCVVRNRSGISRGTSPERTTPKAVGIEQAFNTLSEIISKLKKRKEENF